MTQTLKQLPPVNNHLHVSLTVWLISHMRLDCSIASLFTRTEEKGREASVKHAGVGGGVASKASKENREAVDTFGKKWAY